MFVRGGDKFAHDWLAEQVDGNHLFRWALSCMVANQDPLQQQQVHDNNDQDGSDSQKIQNRGVELIGFKCSVDVFQNAYFTCKSPCVGWLVNFGSDRT